MIRIATVIAAVSIALFAGSDAYAAQKSKASSAATKYTVAVAGEVAKSKVVKGATTSYGGIKDTMEVIRYGQQGGAGVGAYAATRNVGQAAAVGAIVGTGKAVIAGTTGTAAAVAGGAAAVTAGAVAGAGMVAGGIGYVGGTRLREKFIEKHGTTPEAALKARIVALRH